MNAVPKAQRSTKKQYRGRLARSMLLMFLLLTLIPVLVMVALGYSRLYAVLSNQMVNRISSDTVNASALISARTETGETYLNKLASDPRFWPHVETALKIGHSGSYFPSLRQNVVREFEEVNALQPEPNFEKFMIVTPDGTVLISNERSWELKNITGTPLEKLLSVQTTEVLSIVEPINLGGYRVFSSFPVSADGFPLAVIIGVGNPALLMRDLANASIADAAARSYLVTTTDEYLYLNDQRTALVNVLPDAQVKSTLDNAFAQTSLLQLKEYTSQDGSSVLGLMTWNDTLNAGIVTELPRSSIIRNLFSVLSVAAGLVVVLLVVMIVSVSLITGRIVKPITALTENANLFAEGDWSRRAIINRDDEIGALGSAFNKMADDLEELYRSLQWKVEERTQQIRMASEVAATATSAPHLKELLRRTVNLIIERFGYYDVSIFMIDETGVYAVLEQAADKHQNAAKEGIYRLAVGSRSLIGWAAANNQPRVSHDVNNDPLFLKDDQHPETRSEVVVPISVGDTVLGLLDVQSEKENAFAQEDVTILQTITNLIATAIRNIRLLEATEINLEEASLLYTASRQITRAVTREEIYKVAARSLKQSSFMNALLITEGSQMRVMAATGMETETSPVVMNFSDTDLELLIPGANRYLITDPTKTPMIPAELHDLLTEWMVETVAFLPIRSGNEMDSLIVLAARDAGIVTSTAIQPYLNLIEMISTSVEKLQAQVSVEGRLNELQIISEVGRSAVAQIDLPMLFDALHHGILQAIGQVNFLIALYDSDSQMINVPYMADNENISQVAPFPLGQGLTSIVIRNREPLLLKSIDPDELERLGAKMVGAPAKSWLGVPLLYGQDVIGVMAVQDLNTANRFNEDHVRLLSTLASQIAVSIRNTRLLESSRLTAERERTLRELTLKIQGSSDVHRILETTATELSRVLGARRARVEIDLQAAPAAARPNGSKETVK